MMFELTNLKPNGIYDAYLRKSRADISLENIKKIDALKQHEKFIKERAKQLNITIRKWYKEVVSGDTISDRPEIQKLLTKIETGTIDGVLVVDVDRLARGDTSDQGRIANTFKYTDTKIITLQKIYDPNNDEDEEFFEFNLYMARKEYKTINKRLQRGRISSVLEGKFCSSIPPYGYDKTKIPNDKGFMLVPNEKETPIVKEIFKKRFNGTGINIICNYLNEHDIKPRKSDVWTPSSITTILSNPVYLGKLRWGYNTLNKSIKDGKVIKKRIKQENCILVEGLHNAIIDDNTFNAVQKQTDHEPSVRNDKSLKNPLSGLVTCGVCGRKMVRRPHSSKQIKRAENTLNKHELLECLRKHKGDYSLTEISKSVGYSKNIVDKWFVKNLNYFSVPKLDAWYKLKKLLNIKTNQFDKDIELYHTTIEEVHIDSLMCPKSHCSTVSSHLYLVENEIIEMVKKHYDEYNLLEENYNIIENDDNTEILSSLRKQLQELNNKMDKAYDLVESGTYTPTEFTERTKKIKSKIDKVKKEINKIEKINNKNNVKPLLAITKKIIEEYENIDDIEIKNQLLKSIIKRVDYSKIKGGKTNFNKFNLKMTFKF